MNRNRVVHWEAHNYLIHLDLWYAGIVLSVGPYRQDRIGIVKLHIERVGVYEP